MQQAGQGGGQGRGQGQGQGQGRGRGREGQGQGGRGRGAGAGAGQGQGQGQGQGGQGPGWRGAFCRANDFNKWPRPVLVPKRTCSGTGYDVGATVPVAVERRASVLDRSAPSRSRGLSAAHPRRWAA